MAMGPDRAGFDGVGHAGDRDEGRSRRDIGRGRAAEQRLAMGRRNAAGDGLAQVAGNKKAEASAPAFPISSIPSIAMVVCFYPAKLLDCKQNAP